MHDWQCIAELVDNAFDGYSYASKEWLKENSGSWKVDIYLPSLEQLRSGTGEIVIKDYSPGMDKERLINSVKAGWSGNEGYDRLGLFGMGFNISTAKLGKKTRVHSARAADQHFEWIDVDPDAMILHQKQNPNEPFFAMDGTTSKSDMGQSEGTIIRISGLHVDKVEPLISDKAKLRARLGRIYSPLMEKEDIEILIHHETSPPNGVRVKRWQHCVWEGEYKSPIKIHNSSDYESISVKQDIDISLGYDRYCNSCWEWFDENSPPIQDNICPYCGDFDSTESRERKIVGWLGVQRYFSGGTDSPKNHFGIDLVRNGRVIEEISKEFFEITLPNGEDTRVDYPVEGNYKGRIVGSIEINFCPTEPEKSRFERNDSNWDKMMKAMRGYGLRPQKSVEDHGEFISTKLSKIVRAWGTSKAQSGYSPYKQLIPAKIQYDPDGTPKIDTSSKLPFQKADFQTPQAYAKKFRKGDKGYLNDDLWIKDILDSDDFDAQSFWDKWKKDNGIEEECPHGLDPKACKKCRSSPKDRRCVHGNNPATCSICNKEKCEHGNPKGKCVLCESTKIPSNWLHDSNLSGEYSIDIDGKDIAISVDVYQINDDNKIQNRPMVSKKITGYHYQITYNKYHDVFQSFKEDPIDLLMLELASSFYRINNFKKSIIEFYLALKQKYCVEQKLDAKSVSKIAADFLSEVRNEILNWKINGRNLSKSTQDWIQNYFIRNHEDIESANNSLESGEFVSLIPSAMIFEEILADSIPRLCNGTFFTTDLKSATSSAKNYLISDIQACLRQICYVETRSKNELPYHELQSVHNAVLRLRSLMNR